MFRFLCCRTLFLHNNKAAAPTVQSLQNPFLVRECLYSQTAQQPPSLTEYLQASLGFSPEGALKVSKKLKQNIKNPDLIPTFLKSHGFSTDHIKSIIDEHPFVLHYAFPDSTIAPKIQFFKENGLSVSDIRELMVTNPRLFCRSLDRSIKPLVDLVHSILGRHDFVFKLLNRKWVRFKTDAWATNITLLRSCGVNDLHISKMIRKHPGFFDSKPDRFKDIVEKVKHMGFSPLSGLFTEAVFTISSLSPLSWDMKFNVYRSLGWSYEEILSAFRKQPFCMRLSEKNIRRSMDYLTKEIGYDPSYIAMHPILLCYSLEKRIMPRYRFLQLLCSKGYIKKDEILLREFNSTEQWFLKEYVMKYQSKSPGLLKIYESLVGSGELNTTDGKVCNL